MEDKNEKVIVKSYAQPGIDLSVVDLTLVSTVKPRFTKVTKLMYKEKWFTYIGTRDQLDVHDVIQVGCLKLKYKVQKLEKMTDREGYIYKIRRIGDHNTTTVDLDNVELGGSIHIVSRKTFDQMFNYACSLREENPIPTTVDLCCTDACDNLGIEPDPIEPIDPPAIRCTQEILVIEPGVGDRSTEYTNCEGERIKIIHMDSKVETQYTLCLNEIPDFEYVNVDPTHISTGLECGEEIPLPTPVNLYQFTGGGGFFGSPEIVISYIDKDGLPQTSIIPACNSKLCLPSTIEFCAEYGSINISTMIVPIVYAINEPCPSGVLCTQNSDLLYGGNCP